MSTSRRRFGGPPGRRSPGGTGSSSRMCPKYGLARSTEPATLRPRWARSAPRWCICSKRAGRSSGLATATSSRNSRRRVSSSARARAADASATPRPSSVRRTAERSLSSSPTMRAPSGSSSKPRVMSEADEVGRIEGVTGKRSICGCCGDRARGSRPAQRRGSGPSVLGYTGTAVADQRNPRRPGLRG